jgi:hypothetical protein
MPYRIAGIDVNKKKLAVVLADVEVEDEFQFERHWFGSNPEQLRQLAEWLVGNQVEEAVMESTAQCWKPVWGHWNGTGSRFARAGKAQARSPECRIWLKPCLIAAGADAKTTFAMPSV